MGSRVEPGSPFKVSVITAVLNGRNTLEETISSVAMQDYPELEYIVVDGGSTDGTLDVIAQHVGIVDVLVEGPDSGIAEAMNKGLARASGDLVLFLHAEDHFPDRDSLTRAMAHVTDAKSIWAFDILFGQADTLTRSRPRPFNFWSWFKNPLPHQGVLCPRALLDELAGFDQSLKICMDYDFWLKAYRAGARLERVNEVLSIMGDSGISSRRDWSGLTARFQEERRVQVRYTRAGWMLVLHALYWPLYLAYRRGRLLLSAGT